MTAALSRRRLLAVGSAAVALVATGCGTNGKISSGGEGNGTGTITFWDNNGGSRTAVWKEIIARFEQQNPGIKVNYVGVSSSQVQSKYDTTIAGGGTGLPDVGDVQTSQLADLVAQKAVDPLDSRISSSSLQGKIASQFVDSVRAAGGGKQLFTVPTSANMGILWYRTDLFGAAGLAPPTSYDTFFTAAAKLTDKSKNQFGYTLRGGSGSIAQALDMMYGQSGIDSFFNGDTTTVNDPKNVAALQKYADLYNIATPQADVNNDSTKMLAEFDSGRIGVLQHNLGSYSEHVNSLGKDKLAGLPMPTGPNGIRTTVSNPVDGLALLSSSKNKAAAWKFIEFAASADMNSRWNQSAGQIPANTDAQKASWIATTGATKVAIDALNDPNTHIVQLPYYLPDWDGISKSESEPEFQKVLLHQETAKTFLDNFAAKLNAAQAQWKKQNG